MIELNSDKLEISFPEVHENAHMSIDFQRTLRIPDNGKTHYLPPGFGRYPLKHVDDYSRNLPSNWRDRGGVFLPMHQSEALWINFNTGDYPFALKIAAGKINAVTGESWNNDLSQKIVDGEITQDYVVTPDQPWLDGFSIKKGIVRQFIAMPLGSGYTAEEQITGQAEFGGIQIIAFPLKRELYLESMETLSSLCASLSPMSNSQEIDMGLAAGGEIKQEIFTDKKGADAWDTTNSSRCFVHIANSQRYHSVTNTNPPTKPPTMTEYEAAGLPWYDYYDEKQTPLSGSKILSDIQGTDQIKSTSEVGRDKAPIVLKAGS